MTGPLTHAGIIAAGLGSRLRPSHPDTPKPLVPVHGKPLVHWVVSGLRRAGVGKVTLLHNTAGDKVRAYLEREFADLEWDFLRADTASSWESFRLVSRAIAQTRDSFMISTVDALIPPADIARFSREALKAEKGDGAPDAALALTGYVEDEKPLWADVDPAGRIRALGSRARRRDAVTCGLYALTGILSAEMPGAAAHDRLRDYWKNLIAGGRTVRGVLLQKSVDVDRPEDLPAAEKVISCYDA